MEEYEEFEEEIFEEEIFEEGEEIVDEVSAH